MAASQQLHIDELVQKNRAFEATTQRLQSELSTYQARLGIKEDEVRRLGEEIRGMKSEMEKMSGDKERIMEELEVRKKELDGQRKQWEDAVQTMQECHRLITLRNAGMLEAERCERMKVQEEVRKEKVERMRAEFESVRLKGEVMELEAKVDEKDEVLDGVRDRYMEEMGIMIAKVQELEEEYKRLEVEVAKVEGEREALGVRISDLRRALYTCYLLAVTIRCGHRINRIYFATTERTV